MAISALFFNFSKRRKSTKVPLDTSGTTFSVHLKQPTSYDRPVFTLSSGSFNYNYCKFEGQYYFIDDKTSLRNDLWEITCVKDVFATYRTEILASSAYVLYDNQGNSEIVDNRLAIETSRTLDDNAVAFPNVDTSIGRYVLSVVGEDSTNSWVLPYRFGPGPIVDSTFSAGVQNKIDATLPGFTDTATDYTQALKQQNDLIANIAEWWDETWIKTGTQVLSSGNALNCIRNCIWLPFTWSTSGNADLIKLGNFDTGYSGTKVGTVSDPAVIQLPQTSVNIPWQFTDWRRNAPYTQVYLYIPFIGVIQLPAASLTGQAAITIQAALNVISGDLCVNVTNDRQILGSYGANVAVPVPLGTSNITPRQLLNTLIGGLTGAAAAGVGAVTVGAAALAGVASAAVANISGQPTCIGGLSSGAAVGLSTNIICFTICHDTVVSPASVAPVIGLPSFSVKTLSTLSGYVQTAEFSLDAAAEAQDLEEVNAGMNSGVWIE